MSFISNRFAVGRSTVALVFVFLGLGSATGAPEARRADRPPDRLILDVRLFEARTEAPIAALQNLHLSLNTDGRAVTANQWLATIADKAPGGFVAALAWETASVEQGVARIRWPNGSRSFELEVELRRSGEQQDGLEAHVAISFVRSGQVLRRIDQDIGLRVGETALWSGEELRISASDYISHFREYADSENRGLLFERLRDTVLTFVVALSPRRLPPGETAPVTPETLTLPPGYSLPRIDNRLGIPLRGTVRMGFELGPSGEVLNPQIVRSTLPEANPRILGESLQWRFPPLGSPGSQRRWGVVVVPIDLPTSNP